MKAGRIAGTLSRDEGEQLTNVDVRSVISAYDVDSIYKIPMMLHEQMLDDELSPVGQNLAELCKGPGHKISFRPVVTGERMRAFDNPVDLVVYMLEKARAIYEHVVSTVRSQCGSKYCGK